MELYWQRGDDGMTVDVSAGRQHGRDTQQDILHAVEHHQKLVFSLGRQPLALIIVSLFWSPLD